MLLPAIATKSTLNYFARLFRASYPEPDRLIRRAHLEAKAEERAAEALQRDKLRGRHEQLRTGRESKSISPSNPSHLRYRTAQSRQQFLMALALGG